MLIAFKTSPGEPLEVSLPLNHFYDDIKPGQIFPPVTVLPIRGAARAATGAVASGHRLKSSGHTTYIVMQIEAQTRSLKIG